MLCGQSRKQATGPEERGASLSLLSTQLIFQCKAVPVPPGFQPSGGCPLLLGWTPRSRAWLPGPASLATLTTHHWPPACEALATRASSAPCGTSPALPRAPRAQLPPSGTLSCPRSGECLLVCQLSASVRPRLTAALAALSGAHSQRGSRGERVRSPSCPWKAQGAGPAAFLPGPRHLAEEAGLLGEDSLPGGSGGGPVLSRAALRTRLPEGRASFRGTSRR